MSRRNDSPLVDAMNAFVDLPFWCAPVGAVFFYLAMGVLPDLLTSQPPGPVALVVNTMVKGLAPWVAGGVLLSGLFGVAKRAANRRIERRNDPVEPAAVARVKTPGVAPACPKCGGPTVQRLAKKGASAGKAFWGCKEFPKCLGVAR